MGKSGKYFLFLGMILGALTIFGSFVPRVDASQWSPLDSGLRESQVRTVAADSSHPPNIIIGTPKALYQLSTHQLGHSHFERFAVLKNDAALSHVFLAPPDYNFALAATSAGLFQFHRDGSTLSPLLATTRDLNVLSAVLFQDDIIFSTTAGVFQSSTAQAAVSPLFPRLFQTSVYQLQVFDEDMYFVDDQGVWQWSSGFHPQLIYHSSQSEAFSNTDDSSQFHSQFHTRFFVLNHPVWQRVVVSAQGLFFQSPDESQWQRIPTPGLNLAAVRECVLFQKQLWLAGSDGVFRFSNNQRWEPQDQGLTSRHVNDLLAMDDQYLLAATDYGVFVWNESPADHSQTSIREDVSSYFVDDPTIQQVHQWATDFARVNNRKIEQWEANAKRRAWYPSLDMGFDGGKDWDRSDSLWGSSSSGGAHHVGPDDKSSGGQFDWEVNLSWDLADWVWNPDQTAIDVRAKLMVDQREDILDQVTRLYFERQRVLLKIKQLTEHDTVSRQEYQLRFNELSALLDGMTGGRFSRASAFVDRDSEKDY